MDSNSFLKRISDFFKTDLGKRILKWSQRLINVGIIVWLAYELSQIGWLKVWHSLPANPLFYVLFLLTFFQLPLFQILIYRITWSFDTLASFPIFLLKRFYNKDVLGYSGEVYFFAWAKRTLSISGKQIFKTIKDNNIISSVASTLISLGLLGIFVLAGQIKILEWMVNQNQTYFIAGLLLIIIVVFLFVKFRHFVISMPLSTAYEIFGIQMFRLLLNHTFTLLMYYVVVPDIPIYIWFTLIAVEIILSRIPFIPNRDLLFASLSIMLAGKMGAPEDAIAGITLTKGVLNKIGGAASFGLAQLFKKKNIIASPADNADQYNELSEQEE